METASTAIINIFRQGFAITDEIIDFISSTLGITETDQIPVILGEEEVYSSGLMDLIFSPNYDMKKMIEPSLSPTGMSKEKIDIIIEEIISAVKNVAVYMEHNNTRISIIPEPYLIKLFVKKCNLHKSYNLRYNQIEKYGNKGLIISARTIIRTIKYHKTELHEDFIFRLVEKLIQSKIDEGSLKRDIQLLLNIFSENSEDEDIFEILARKKDKWEQQIHEVERFNQLMTRYSMEILMMQRITPPAVNIDELLENISSIDNISNIMFNRSADFINEE